MSTEKETISYILEKFGSERFTARAMFGEYALYTDGKVVALVCDNLLYVKITPQSIELEPLCEKDVPYKGARSHYVVEEEQLQSIEHLADILIAVAEALPTPKPKKKKVTKEK
jgi:TfoX/Sxy family transcriptional regulator of competence genes